MKVRVSQSCEGSIHRLRLRELALPSSGDLPCWSSQRGRKIRPLITHRHRETQNSRPRECLPTIDSKPEATGKGMCGLPRPYAEMKGFKEIGLGQLLVRVTPQAAMMFGSICRKPVQRVVTAQEIASLTKRLTDNYCTQKPGRLTNSQFCPPLPRGPPRGRCTFSLWWPLVFSVQSFQKLLLLFLEEEA